MLALCMKKNVYVEAYLCIEFAIFDGIVRFGSLKCHDELVSVYITRAGVYVKHENIIYLILHDLSLSNLSSKGVKVVPE